MFTRCFFRFIYHLQKLNHVNLLGGERNTVLIVFGMYLYIDFHSNVLFHVCFLTCRGNLRLVTPQNKYVNFEGEI